MQKIFDDGFEAMELKARMVHTARVLHDFLPENFAAAVETIKRIITCLRAAQFGEGSLEFMFFPEYIALYGLDDFTHSVQAFEFITQFVSCEFAVRPFILKYGAGMISCMKAWSLHENHNVRRLASEGSRPRLPWAMALPQLKKDPQPILPILEQLKNDPSESVRRSVANSLNDIAKDNPAAVLSLAAAWKGATKETDAIIKHGSRTLLKQGHAEILRYFGLSNKGIKLEQFYLLTPQVPMGGNLEFSFTVRNNNSAAQKIRLEYAVYYKRLNGKSSKKVFKISERSFAPNERAVIHRKQKFKPITTRKFYSGSHQLSLIINGEEKGIRQFELMDNI